MKDNNTDIINNKSQEEIDSNIDNQTCNKDGSCCEGECLKNNDAQTCCQYYDDSDLDTCKQCRCFCGGCECSKKKTFWKSEAFIFISGVLLGITVSLFFCFMYMSFSDNHNYNNRSKNSDYRYEISF